MFSWHGREGVTGLVLVLGRLPAGGISLLFLVIVPPIARQRCLWLINLWSFLLREEMLQMGFPEQLGLLFLLLAS